ncbi:MAG TPA: glycosyltransferase [Chitinophagaceae bacterium]
MLKILHVIDKMNPETGGVCRAVRSIITGLSEKNVYNEVVCLDLPEAPFIQELSFSTHALGYGKRPWAFHPKLIPWLNKNIPRFDVIVVHGLWLFHSYAVKKSIQRFKQYQSAKGKVPKFFIMPHGMLDPYFQKASGRKLKAIRNWIYWKIIEGSVINSADALLFTCNEERRLAREPFQPYYPKQETVIGLGIERPPTFNKAMSEAFHERCPGLKNAPYLLYLGRIHEKKGVDLLINAFGQIVKEIGSSESNSDNQNEIASLKLVIAGPGGETSYGQKIWQMASENVKLKDRIFFPGMLTGDAKWGAFYGCDAFVLPSHQENFGVAMVEALACSKPVLISNQVNIWKEIKETGAGLITEDSMEGIHVMLCKWFNLSGDEKMVMRHKAKLCYEKHFAIASAVKVLLNAIKD